MLFKVGQMVVAKRTVWSNPSKGLYSSSHADDHVPRLLILEGKEYEVIYVNYIGRHNISIHDEDGESSWDLDPYISEWTGYDCKEYEFPFYTIQEWREKTLEEIGI